MKTQNLAESSRVESGKHFRLKDSNPADTVHCQMARRRKITNGSQGITGQQAKRLPGHIAALVWLAPA